jgi:hypothetical protein
MNTQFDCLIPDRPLTGYEQFAVGTTTRGAYRGIFRDARVSIEGDELFVRAKTDIAAGGSEVIAVKLPVKDIIEVRLSPFPVNKQILTAFGRSLIVGSGLALTILIGVLATTGGSQHWSVNPNTAYAVIIIGGLILGLLVSFRPALAKIEHNLTQVLLFSSDGKALMLAVRTEQKEAARAILSSCGSKLTEAEDSSDSA